MSTSGASLRDSTQTQAGQTTAAIANRPSVRGESHPHVGPSLTATSSATSQPASSTAPSGVDAARRADRRLGHVGNDAGRRDERPRRAAARRASGRRGAATIGPDEHDPEAAADAQDRRDERDAVRHPVARELVADDREREREHRAPGALDDPRRRSSRRSTSRAPPAPCRRRGSQARSPSCASSRTCRRAARRSASRLTRSAGRRSGSRRRRPASCGGRAGSSRSAGATSDWSSAYATAATASSVNVTL